MDDDRADDPEEPGDFAVLHARYLHRLDQQLADLRKTYESFSPDERLQLRKALLKAVAMNKRLADLGIRLKVEVEHVECDEDGEMIRPADCEFSAATVLLAVRAWDAGKDFTPDRFLP